MSTIGAAAAQSTSFVQAARQAWTGGPDAPAAPAAGNARVATAFDHGASLLELSTHDVLSAVRGRGQLAQVAAQEHSPGAAHSQVAARYAAWSGPAH